MSGGGQGSSDQGASSLGAFGFNAFGGGNTAPNRSYGVGVAGGANPAPNQSYGGFNQGGYGSQMSSPFQGGYGGYGSQMGSPFQGGYGYGGGYGPTGNMWGNDLGSMYNTYGGDPQALASQMQYSGVSPFNMQQAGVMSPQGYTQMYRPSNQYQSETNPNQYYQPIYQSQYQNYASPYYSVLSQQNNMGQNYQSPFNPYSNQDQGVGGLLNQFNERLRGYSTQPEQAQNQAPTTTVPTTVPTTAPTTPSLVASNVEKPNTQAAAVPAWQTNKDYSYSTYANFKPEELMGLSKNEMTSAYKPLLSSINNDIKQATIDYNAAVKSGNIANIKAANANLAAQRAELTQYKTDYGSALAGLKKRTVRKADGGLLSLMEK